MGRGNSPFSRFAKFMEMAAALLASKGALNFGDAVRQLGGYKSRGHGIKTRSSSGTVGGKYSIHASGWHYPERSLRQENRQFRRAQGGPGLDERNQPRA